jgi:thioesterase domain-containing protein
VTVAELLSQMRRLDVNVSVDGDRLRLSAPPGVLTLELRDQLIARKPEVLAFLRTAKKLGSPAESVVAVQPQGTRHPFFAIPGHNGDVFCYVHLARHLGDDQPFYALQPPGLDGTQAPAETIEALAAHFVRELRRFAPRGPYLLGGFCLGGSVAFETARQLREQGQDVRLLALLGSPCPTSFRPLNRTRAATKELIGRFGLHVRLLMRSPGQHLRHLAVNLRKRVRLDDVAKGAPDAVSSYRQRVERAAVSAVRAYSPRPFEGRITLIVPNKAWATSLDRPMDWGALARDGLETVVGPPECNGDILLREPHVRWLAGELRIRLDRAQRNLHLNAAG